MQITERKKKYEEFLKYGIQYEESLTRYDYKGNILSILNSDAAPSTEPNKRMHNCAPELFKTHALMR